MPSARQKRHQTVLMKLADCQDSCRVFVLTSRSDHVIVYATAKLIMDGGLPNYRPTRLNDSGNFFRPLTKNIRFFHILIFYLNSPNHALHSCILLAVFLVGKSYWISIFKYMNQMHHQNAKINMREQIAIPRQKCPGNLVLSILEYTGIILLYYCTNHVAAYLVLFVPIGT